MSFASSLEGAMYRFRSHVFDERSQSHLVVGLTALVALACVHLLTIPAATEFETSLVVAYPLSYWVAFYLTFALALVLALVSARTGTGYWRHALVLLLCDYATYFFLARARGYRLYGRGASDILRHLGDVKGILNTGSLPGIWYPAEHVFFAELASAGIPLEAVMFPVGFVFTALYIVSAGVLLRTLVDRSLGLVVGFCVAAPLIYAELHLTVIPSTLSFFFFPVILFVVERYRRTRANAYLVLFTVFAVMTVFFHPMTAIFLICLLSVTSAFTFVYARLFDTSVSVLSPRLGLAIPPLLFAWLVNFRETSAKILRVYNSYVVDTGQQTPAQAEAAETMVLSVPEIVMRAFQVYGSLAIYAGIAGLFGLWLAYRLLRTRELPYLEGYLSVQFAVGASIFIVVMTGFFVVGEPVRIARYMLFMATLVIGTLLVRQFELGRTVMPAFLVVCVVLAGIFGANAAYEPNEHLTDAEYEGVSFVAHNQNGEVVQAFEMTNKMEEYVLGSGHPALYPETYTVTTTLPPRLGYGTNESAGQTFGLSYVSTKVHDRKYSTAKYFTPAQRESMFLYDDGDLAKLQRDDTANKIFANSGFETWRVVPDEYYQSNETAVDTTGNATTNETTGTTEPAVDETTNTTETTTNETSPGAGPAADAGGDDSASGDATTNETTTGGTTEGGLTAGVSFDDGVVGVTADTTRGGIGLLGDGTSSPQATDSYVPASLVSI